MTEDAAQTDDLSKKLLMAKELEEARIEKFNRRFEEDHPKLVANLNKRLLESRTTYIIFHRFFEALDDRGKFRLQLYLYNKGFECFDLGNKLEINSGVFWSSKAARTAHGLYTLKGLMLIKGTQ